MKQLHADVIIVGGGHAGLEAATILENLGNSVTIITMDPRSIGRMSCNPAIGGLAKGQMVREIDMLGGKMGVLADLSGIQFKTLNKKKGRAVWSPRAQVDKRSYEKKALQLITKSKCSVLPGEVVSLFYNKNSDIISNTPITATVPHKTNFVKLFQVFLWFSSSIKITSVLL